MSVYYIVWYKFMALKMDEEMMIIIIIIMIIIMISIIIIIIIIIISCIIIITTTVIISTILILFLLLLSLLLFKYKIVIYEWLHNNRVFKDGTLIVISIEREKYHTHDVNNLPTDFLQFGDVKQSIVFFNDFAPPRRA